MLTIIAWCEPSKTCEPSKYGSESMRKVNPEGVLLRTLAINTVNPRNYQVYAPLALWHIDGNYKLIRLIDNVSY